MFDPQPPETDEAPTETPPEIDGSYPFLGMRPAFKFGVPVFEIQLVDDGRTIFGGLVPLEGVRAMAMAWIQAVAELEMQAKLLEILGNDDRGREIFDTLVKAMNLDAAEEEVEEDEAAADG